MRRFLGGLKRLAAWRALPVRDARGRWGLVGLVNLELQRRAKRELAAGAAAVALLSVVSVVAGWRWGPLFIVPLLAMLYAISTKDRLLPMAKEHRRSCVRTDRCAWCNGALDTSDFEGRRRCTQCEAHWWDVAGIEAGTSPRQHRRRRTGATIGAALVGLLLGGFVLVGLREGVSVGSIIWCSLMFVIGWSTSVAYSRNFAHPLVETMAIAVWPVVAGGMRIMDGSWEGGSIVVGGGLLAAYLAFIGGERGARLRPRDVLQGVGRECAQCGYDLRSLGAGVCCPECGSNLRVR